MNAIELDDSSDPGQNIDFLENTVKSRRAKLNKNILYGMGERTNLPRLLAVFLAVQNVITAICGIIVVINVLAPKFCILLEDPARAHLLSTAIMTAGISTLFQTSVGVKLPIVHTSGFVYMICTVSIMNLPILQCPVEGDLYSMGPEKRTEVWQSRIQNIQGAIIATGIVQMLLGYSGAVGKAMKYITPLTVVPTMCLVGVSVIENGVVFMSGNWTIAIITIFFLTLFSQYLRKVKVPIPVISFATCGWIRVKLFALFSILFSVIIVWIGCIILTNRNILLPTDSANTDSKSGVYRNSQIFRLPYPFQWGWPKFNWTYTIAMLPALFSSIVESVGNYYICARYANQKLPPKNVTARGVSVQGLSSILAGLLGTGLGVSASSENVGNIGITRVCSRKVIVSASWIMIFLSPFIKIIAMIVTLPDPVLGAVTSLLLALIAASALSNLQFINLNSIRNMYILGLSLCFGLILPKCISQYSNFIDTKYEIVNDVVFMYMSSGPFIGGLVGFILDNTIPDDDGEMNGNPYCDSDDELKMSIEDEDVYKISDKIYDVIHFFYTYVCCD